MSDLLLDAVFPSRKFQKVAFFFSDRQGDDSKEGQDTGGFCVGSF